MTNLERATINAITEWCKREGLDPQKGLRHIHPRAYVLGKAASQCLVVAQPPCDAEPQLRGVNNRMGADGSTIVHIFDKSLKAGDWCSTAYVCMSGSQERVAIHAVSA